LGIGMSAEEAKIVEQNEQDSGENEEIALEVAEEPTIDELIASIEEVVDKVNDAVNALTTRIERLEKLVGEKLEGKNVVEGLLKNSKSMIPVEDAIKMIQNVLPSPMVERSWGFGPQRLCQELRGVVLKLRKRVRKDERTRKAPI